MVLGCELGHTEPRFILIGYALIYRLLHTVTTAGVVNAHHVGVLEELQAIKKVY